MLYIFVVNHSEDNMFRIGFDGCNLRFQILPSGKVMSCITDGERCSLSFSHLPRKPRQLAYMFEAVLYAFIFDFYSFFLQAFHTAADMVQSSFLIVAFSSEASNGVRQCKWIGEFLPGFLMNIGWSLLFHSQ